jgi:hypothetical protein
LEPLELAKPARHLVQTGEIRPTTSQSTAINNLQSETTAIAQKNRIGGTRANE